MNKKILALLMALMMIITSAVAFAEGDTTEPVTRNDLISKNFKIVDGTTSDVDFTFTVTAKGVEEAAEGATAPTISIADASYDANEDGPVALVFTGLEAKNFPSVGYYTYEITEVDDKIAGYDYDTAKIVMKVAIVQGKDDLEIQSIGFTKDGVNNKLDSDGGFDNKFTAGDLSISKTVTGNLGDTSKYFEFSVTLTGEEGVTSPTTLNITGGSHENNPETITVGTEATVYLKHGETLVIENLPKGMTYTVTEETYTDYTTTTNTDDANGVIDVVADGDTTADDLIAFTNDKSETIDTGINTDSMPYIMLMAFVMMIAAAVVLKKRTVNE